MVSKSEAEALNLISETLKKANSNTVNYLLTQTYLKSYKEIISKSSLVVTPENKGDKNDFMSLASMLMLNN